MAENVPEELDFVAGHLIELPFGEIRVNTGVYFLIWKGAVVYVGMTTTGARRPMAHLGHKRFDRALYLPVRKNERHLLFTVCEVETAFIQRLKPPLNAGQQAKPRRFQPHHLNLDAWYGGRREEEKKRLRAHHQKGQAILRARWAARKATTPLYHLKTLVSFQKQQG